MYTHFVISFVTLLLISFTFSGFKWHQQLNVAALALGEKNWIHFCATMQENSSSIIWLTVKICLHAKLAKKQVKEYLRYTVFVIRSYVICHELKSHLAKNQETQRLYCHPAGKNKHAVVVGIF